MVDVPEQGRHLQVPKYQLMIIEGNIETRRKEAVGRMLGLLDDFREFLCRDSSCSFECAAVRLGSLIRHMHQAGLTNLCHKRPFIGYSIDWLYKTISDFWAPNDDSHRCQREAWLKPGLADILEATRDIEFEDIKNRREASCSQVQHPLRRGA